MGVKFILLINVKMQTIVGILTFISRINTSSESFTESKFILEHSCFFKKNLEVIIHADLSWWNYAITNLILHDAETSQDKLSIT